MTINLWSVIPCDGAGPFFQSPDNPVSALISLCFELILLKLPDAGLALESFVRDCD